MQGWCSGCSGSCLPLGGARGLSRVLSGVLSRVLRIMFVIGRCQGAVQGAVQGVPDHVCHGAVQRCCPGCSGSRLLLGGVRVLLRVLSRVLRIMFAIGWCQNLCLPLGGVRVLSRVLSRVLRIMFAIGRCQSRVLPLRGAVQGAPDHVCHGAVQGAIQRCCPGCSGSCLPLGGVRVLFAWIVG